jgi:rsbT co-antagonist protein RsbR
MKTDVYAEPEYLRQQRRIARAIEIGIAIMLFFSTFSIVDAAGDPSQVKVLSALTDGSFVLFLIGWRLNINRMRLPLFAVTVGWITLLYSLLNMLLYPDSMLRLALIPLLAIALTLTYVSNRALLLISIGGWLVLAIGTFRSPTWLDAGDVPIDAIALLALAALLLVVLYQFHGRMNESLQRAQDANNDLRTIRAGLEEQVTARTAELQRTLDEMRTNLATQERLLAENSRQREHIRSLSLPVLPLDRQTLVVPLVGDLDDERLNQLGPRLLQAIEDSHARRLFIDITGVAVIDQPIAQELLRTVAAARLLGADVTLIGVNPDVAQTIVGLGIEMHGIHSEADLQSALGPRPDASKR